MDRLLPNHRIKEAEMEVETELEMETQTELDKTMERGIMEPQDKEKVMI